MQARGFAKRARLHAGKRSVLVATFASRAGHSNETARRNPKIFDLSPQPCFRFYAYEQNPSNQREERQASRINQYHERPRRAVVSAPNPIRWDVEAWFLSLCMKLHNPPYRIRDSRETDAIKRLERKGVHWTKVLISCLNARRCSDGFDARVGAQISSE